MKSKFKKLMAAALVLCLMLALLPAGVLASGQYQVIFADANGNPKNSYDYGTVTATLVTSEAEENNSGNTFNGGDTVRITAKPNENCGLVSLAIGKEQVDITDPENGASKEFVISADTVVKVAFRPYYNITTTADNCVVEVANKAMRYENVSFKVTPNRGYEVTDVKVGNDSITSQNGTYTFEMPNNEVNITVTTTERSDGHSITITTDNNGTVTVASPANTTTYYEGETIQLNVTPKEGYELESITGAEIGTGNTFTMPDNDVTVSATFKETTYNITADTPTNGTVSFTVNDAAVTTANYGDQIVVTVDPDDGYYLKSLKINDDEVSYWVNWNWYWNYDGTGTYTFNMPAENVNIEAEFTDQLRIDTNYNGYRGEVEVLVKDDASGEWVDTNFADRGDWVAFKPVAYTNYDIGAISVTGNWTGRSYDVETFYWHNGWYYFQMPWENVTINVEFTDNSHAVNVKDASNGTLKANTKWAVEDERVYITAVPDKGYELTWLSVKAEDGTKIDVYEALKEDTYYFFMPDQAVTISAIFAYDYPDMPFTDVNSNSWYFNAIEFVYNKGIMQGVSSTKFSPNGTVTRGMLVTMLWRMAGEPYVGGGSFDDVASGSYYATAVAWAAKNGIVDGYNSTRFGPNDAVTREQIATMLYRYAKWLGYSTSGSSLAGYSDASSVSSWAKDAMGWAVKNSVVTGVTATKLNPASSATRAETAQMFMNFYEYLN